MAAAHIILDGSATVLLTHKKYEALYTYNIGKDRLNPMRVL